MLLQKISLIKFYQFMRNRILSLLTFLLSFGTSWAQEIDCQIIVNSDLVNQTNQQIFKTLEQSLREFLNTQTWTNTEVLRQERITCSFVFNFTSYADNQFEGTLQINSQRPVFDSNYDSPILNFLDKDILFSYQEFEPLFYNSATFESNLTSLISFYVYVILGLDADSFQLNGGTPYYEQAQRIATLAQVSNLKGWNQNDGNRNRYWIIDTLLSNTYREYRQSLYDYHRNGLDKMTENPLTGKKEIIKAITQLEPLYKRRPNALLLQMFFDSKAKEIVNIFSGGPEVETQDFVFNLKKIAPFFSPNWKQIKN